MDNSRRGPIPGILYADVGHTHKLIFSASTAFRMVLVFTSERYHDPSVVMFDLEVMGEIDSPQEARGRQIRVHQLVANPALQVHSHLDAGRRPLLRTLIRMVKIKMRFGLSLHAVKRPWGIDSPFHATHEIPFYIYRMDTHPRLWC